MAQRCYKCGKELRDGALFCRFCGASLSEPPADKQKPVYEPKHGERPVMIDKPSLAERLKPAARQEQVEELKQIEFDEEDIMDDDKPSIDSKKIMLAIIIILVIAVCALAAKLISGGSKPEDTAVDTEVTEDTVDLDSLVEDSSEETPDTQAGIYEIDSTDVRILSSDWDWDSSTREGSMYRVDAVLYVNNKSSRPVTQLEFSVMSEHGDTIYDENTGNSYFTAYGYIDPGTKGFMVADVYTEEEKVRPDDETYSIRTAYNNGSIGEYHVPTGYISGNYGPNNDYYDIEVDNPNDFAVNESARVVAVRTKGNTLKEGEASGRLSSYIEGETYGFVQERAFDNPNLHSDYKDMTVYLIDIDYLREY